LYGSFVGMLRFFLDAFLVVLYGFMLTVYRQLELVAALLVLIFILYTIWDFLKLAEYRKPPFDRFGGWENADRSYENFIISLIKNLIGRESIIYLVPISAIFAIEYANCLESLGLWKDVLIIIALLIVTTVYRIHKVNWNLLGDEEKIGRTKSS
ncbi:hypothetical protein, partial [Haloarcula marismortui]